MGVTMSLGTTNLGRGFHSAEAKWLEPPEYLHISACEAMRWYWCSLCERPFMEDADDGTPLNMHDCGQLFNKRYDECVCEWIGE